MLVILLARDGFAQEPLPEEQLETVNAAIASIEDWLNDASQNRGALERELRSASQRLDATRSAVAASRVEIQSVTASFAQLDAERITLEQAQDEQQALAAAAVTASYLSGQEPYLKLLLNQQDPTLGSRMLTYYRDYNAARLAKIEAFRDTLTQLESTRADIAAARESLDSQQHTLEAQLATLATEQAEREALLLALNKDIASRSTELDQLTADRQHLEALLEQIQTAIIAIPAPDQLTPFAQARGTLPWPVEGRPLNRFGETYSDGNLHRQGVVLQAERGSPVRAIHPGRVVFSDWLRGSGLLVVVDHGDGYLSLYANNQSLVKQKGDWVNRAEALATAGENGGAEQPGIYFEIRHNGQAQDPAQWCVSPS